VPSKNNPNDNDVHARVRSVDLDAPTLVDQIGAELLDHLIACRKCLLIFAAQEDSIGEAGCIEGIRIVSQSELRWQERRSCLALRHLTEQTMDDFLFDRFISDERQAIEHHLRNCSRCLQEIHQRATLYAGAKEIRRFDLRVLRGRKVNLCDALPQWIHTRAASRTV
jgi:hypothetical protein